MSNRWPEKVVIGLTGNIATGKSVVRRMLEHLGAFGIDADGLAHRAMSPGAPAYQPIIDTFGKWLLAPDGQIDREKLGNVVFADPEALERLEAITHPIIKQVLDLLIRRAKQKVVVIEAIKLIEASLGKDCDSVWVIDAPEEVQLQRLMSTRKLSEPAARVRIEAQPPQADKIARAHVVVQNADGYEETYDQVQRHFNALLGVSPEAVPEPEPEPVEVPTAPGEARITIQRGGPKHAEGIAAFITQMQGVSLERKDVLLRFGQKAYMLAYSDDKIIGLAGFKVENLITRVDEFQLAPGAPIETVGSLIDSVENASHALQSEISLLFLSNSTPEAIGRAIMDRGYEPRVAADLRVPDWREAAEDSAPPNSFMVAKKLREDRVLKPL